VSGVTVAGGIFQGTGTVNGNVAINGGVHSPDNSTGLSTVSGYALGTSGALQVEVNGTTAGSQYDQVRILGISSTVTLAGSLDLVAAPALAAGSNFTIIDNTGLSAVSGTFAGLSQGAEFFEDGQWWRISYTGGSGGNDVVLTRMTPARGRAGWRQTSARTRTIPLSQARSWTWNSMAS